MLASGRSGAKKKKKIHTCAGKRDRSFQKTAFGSFSSFKRKRELKILEGGKGKGFPPTSQKGKGILSARSLDSTGEFFTEKSAAHDQNKRKGLKR